MPPGALSTQTGNEEKGFIGLSPLSPGMCPPTLTVRGILFVCALVCMYWQNLINRR